MAPPPPQDERPDDLTAALERLVLGSDGPLPPPRPSQKTLVPWTGGTGEQPAGEPATTLPETGEHPGLAAEGAAPAPAPLPPPEALTPPEAPAAPPPGAEAVSEPAAGPEAAASDAAAAAITADGTGDDAPAPAPPLPPPPPSAPQLQPPPEYPTLPVPAEAPYALEVVAGPAAGLVVGVGRRSAMVGRVLGALQVDDPFISDGHASFQVRGGRLVLVDGGAPSGVYVSAPPVTVLAPGQCFAVGLQVFRFLGPLEGPGPQGTYGAPFPRRAYRVEHVLVGDRSGRVVLFRYSASVGRRRGTFQFPDDEALEEVHAELRPGPGGMELVTHARQAPTFVRLAPGTDQPLQHGDLVRFGITTVRVVSRL